MNIMLCDELETNQNKLLTQINKNLYGLGWIQTEFSIRANRNESEAGPARGSFNSPPPPPPPPPIHTFSCMKEYIFLLYEVIDSKGLSFHEKLFLKNFLNINILRIRI